MAFWRTYYHLIWATKERQPLITQEKETELYGYIIGKANALECIIHAINGTENHIHIVASIPPKLSIAEFVKKIKGSSAYHLNHCKFSSDIPFAWQKSYGVLTLGSKQLDDAKGYVNNQKEHHRNGTIIMGLERDFNEK